MAKRHRSHILDIYGVHLHVATSLKGWKQLRRHLTFLDEKPGGLGFVHHATWHPDDGSAHTTHVAILINDEAHQGDLLNLLDTCAHEAAHAAGHILDYIGEPYGGASEPHAYLVGWITRFLWETLGERVPQTR